LAVDQPKEQKQPEQIIERKNRQKKKQAHDHNWDMSL